MTTLLWLSAALYFVARGTVLLVWGALQVLFYGVLFVGWLCIMGVMLPFRVVAALNQPRRRSA